MKKCVITCIIITSVTLGCSLAQKNYDSLNYLTTGEKAKIPNLKLPNYANGNFSFNSRSLIFRPFIGVDNISILNQNTLRGFNDINLIGHTQSTQFKLMNTPIKTYYQFDINGRFRSSSMSIKLNK